MSIRCYRMSLNTARRRYAAARNIVANYNRNPGVTGAYVTFTRGDALNMCRAAKRDLALRCAETAAALGLGGATPAHVARVWGIDTDTTQIESIQVITQRSAP